MSRHVRKWREVPANLRFVVRDFPKVTFVIWSISYTIGAVIMYVAIQLFGRCGDI